MYTLTPTEQQLIDCLSDGQFHHADELRRIVDEHAEQYVVWQHMNRIRKKLRPVGEDVVCYIHNNKGHYRHVRIVSIAE